jgi:hypothetical protein
MTPEELSCRHPRLFHVTLGGMSESIVARGLRSTSRLLDLFEVTGEKRERIERRRRPNSETIHHPMHGTVIINDQRPMTEAALTGCLDDGLMPADWFALLNRRVFFWASEDGLGRFLGARANRKRAMEVLTIDTLSLARSHAERMELSPINSGATMRKPVRRGSSTFTPVLELSHAAWSRKRGGRDRILEVTVLDGVPDIARHKLCIRSVEPSG